MHNLAGLGYLTWLRKHGILSWLGRFIVVVVVVDDVVIVIDESMKRINAVWDAEHKSGEILWPLKVICH